MVLKSLCVSMGMFIVTAASAQTYPDRAIKILQGFAPGRLLPASFPCLTWSSNARTICQ